MSLIHQHLVKVRQKFWWVFWVVIEMKKKKIKEFYENYHKVDEGNPIEKFKQKERLNSIFSITKNLGGKGLVIGCGSQNDMNLVSPNSFGVGVDISTVAIKKSIRKYNKSRFIVSDATNLPFMKNSFDYVICSEVIEHIKDDEKVLFEVKRILKNHGIFILTLPNWLSLYGLSRKLTEFLFRRPFTAGDQPIDNWSTPSKISKKLKKYNLEIIFFRGIWYYPPTGKGKKQIPWVITLPLFKIFYPVEMLLRTILPWFGHIIIFKAYLVKYDRVFL